MLTLEFTPFPILETERLILRKPSPFDVTDIFLLRSDPKVNEFIVRPATENEDMARTHIEKVINSINNNEAIEWVITLKGQPGVIGTIVYWNIAPAENRAELGYQLMPAYHRQGIMHEVFNAVLDYGFNIMGLESVEAYTHHANDASRKLLEKNLFTRDLEAEEGRDMETDGHNTIYRRGRG